MKLRAFICVLVLCGCFDDISGLQAELNQIRASAVPPPQPLPAIQPFKHFGYVVESKRSPFVMPEPESIQSLQPFVQDCLAPDPRRRKQPLERYALDNLKMRGTLGQGIDLWALIESGDGNLFRVAVGNFIGLYNGKIAKVSPDQVELVELIPDGAGCWKERLTKLSMND